MNTYLSKSLLLVLVLTLIMGIGSIAIQAEEEIVEIGGYDLRIPNVPSEELDISVVYMNTTAVFAQYLREGVRDAAEEFDVNAYFTGGNSWTTESQYNALEDEISRQPDALAVAVLDRPAISPLIERALEAGIPTICYNVDAPDSGRLGFVGQNLEEAGAATARTLIEYMGYEEEKNIFIVTEQLEAFHSQARLRGVEKVLDEYPNVNIVEIVNATGDEQQAYATIENQLLTYPNIDGAISLGGSQVLFAKALQRQNKGNIDSDNPIYNVGHDIDEEKLNLIKEGWATATFGQQGYKQTFDAVKMLSDFLKTGDPDVFEVIDTPIQRIDRSNVDEIIEDFRAGKPIG